MEQTPLPIKTKIAVWWMIVIGGIFLIMSLLAIILFIGYAINRNPLALRFIFICPFSLLGIIFYLNPGLSLLKNKKGAWKSAVIRLSVLMILFIILFCLYFFLVFLLSFAVSPGHSLSSNWGIVMVGFFLIPLVIFFTPLILLILDRKNFFKIAS